MTKQTETCGRCSMTSVVGATESDDEEGADRDLFGEDRIEVPEDQMRLVAAPHVLAGRVTAKLDEIATRLTYGR